MSARFGEGWDLFKHPYRPCDRQLRVFSGVVGVLVAALVLLGGSEDVSAATLKAKYQLRGDRTSQIGGAPALADLGTGNRFAVEAFGGIERKVLAFQPGDGLALATDGLVDSGNHSVVMLFRLADLSGYRRILDFTNGASDNGLYNLQGRAVLYVDGNAGISRSAVFDGSYAQVALTNSAASGGAHQTAVYVNGTAVAAARTSEDFGLQSGLLRFFKDNVSGPGVGEESAGAVACVLVYDGALTAREVRRVAASPRRCSAPRSPRRQADAFATSKPLARTSGRRIVVDTGLTVRCPAGRTPCVARGRVDVVGRRTTARIKRLGSVRLAVLGGSSRSVRVRLSRRAGRALRKAGTLRVRVSADIVAPGGRRGKARQAGRIEVPQPPSAERIEVPQPPTRPIEAPHPHVFQTGPYTGTTSQGLPISLGVGQTFVESVRFRWRALCADGEIHENWISLGASFAPIDQGRFAIDTVLTTGGTAQVSGTIQGSDASGTLSRAGMSAFGTECDAKDIAWQAHASGAGAAASIPR